MRRSPLARDRYALYEAAVQGVEFDLDFFERVYRHLRGGRFRLFREDFCGTAQLACAWALRRPENRSWGVDLDPEPLAWVRTHRLARMREAARRVTLIERDVREVSRPRVDVVCALNFSYWVFRERETLRSYFRSVKRSLRKDGLLFVNLFGGTEALDELVETRRIPPTQGPDGLRIPGFVYRWEHVAFNVIDHHIRCAIHFRFADGTEKRRAFTYDWRLWTLPEVQEVMQEAGFRSTRVYVEAWDHEKDEPAEWYRHQKWFDNQEGWLAFVVGLA